MIIDVLGFMLAFLLGIYYFFIEDTVKIKQIIKPIYNFKA